MTIQRRVLAGAIAGAVAYFGSGTVAWGQGGGMGPRGGMGTGQGPQGGMGQRGGGGPGRGQTGGGGGGGGPGMGGGMGQRGGGRGGMCGPGMGSSQMSGSPGVNNAALRGSPMSRGAPSQQQLIGMPNGLAQMQTAQLLADQRYAAWLRTAPRPGPAQAEMSPAWTSATLTAGPTATVTPGKAPVPMAISPPLLTAFRVASDANLTKSIERYIRDAEVLLVEEPLSVVVETRYRGLAYVRPTEGSSAGKFFVVDERYVK